jgi:hypothetical protein
LSHGGRELALSTPTRRGLLGDIERTNEQTNKQTGKQKTNKQTADVHVLSANSFNLVVQPLILSSLHRLMAPKPWATEEQQDFLIGEDSRWSIIKASTGTLKNFYARTTMSFLEKWPAVPDEKMLKEAKGDAAKADALAKAQALKVSIVFSSFRLDPLLFPRIAHHELVHQSPPRVKVDPTSIRTGP